MRKPFGLGLGGLPQAPAPVKPPDLAALIAPAPRCYHPEPKRGVKQWLRTPKIATTQRRCARASTDCQASLKVGPRRRPHPEPRREAKPDGVGSAMSLGLRAGSEFVSAVIVGLGIGWVIDRGLGTNPAFLIVFFLVGVAAGVWNVIRLTSPKAAPIQPQFALVSPGLAG